MQVVYRRCGGLDVHKDTITATVLVFGEDGEREVRKKEFGTHWKELQRLGKWLRACRVERVAMESTGVYWKPVWNVLERSLPMVLANPYQVKNIPSRKTDRRDSEWIADLLAHDLIRPSFVPPVEIRQLRELTRYRVQLTGERNRVHNRIHKVLEDANIKLDTVLSDLLGVSGRAMLRAIVNGHCDPGWLADYARGSLRGKREQLELVLHGQIQDHHRCLLAELLADLEFVESKILRLEQELLRRMEPYQDLIDRLCGIPGVDVLTSWTLIAELGPDMTVFPDAAHAASWAGLCPGNRERWQTPERSHSQGQSLAAPSSVPIGLGCHSQTRLLPRRAFLSTGRSARRQESHRRYRTSVADHCLSSAARRHRLSRTGRQLLRPTPSPTNPEPTCPPPGTPRIEGRRNSPTLPATIACAQTSPRSALQML